MSDEKKLEQMATSDFEELKFLRRYTPELEKNNRGLSHSVTIWFLATCLLAVALFLVVIWSMY